LRRSFDKASGTSPLHLVQAFAVEARLVLGQVAVDQKSNEITAIPELLSLLDVKERIVTADAMHTQRATAAAVCAKGGGYVLAHKGILDRPVQVIETKGLEQAQNLHILAPPHLQHSRLHEAAQGMELFGKIPFRQGRCVRHWA